MRWWKKDSSCGRVWRWLGELVAGRGGIPAALRRHVAGCPRCARLAGGANRLALGLLLLKSQPHGAGLLMRANRQALGVLQRSLREAPAAEKLRAMAPRRTLLERVGRYTQSVAHAAACLVVLLLLRHGVFTGLNRAQEQGRRAVEKYYTSHLDQDLVDQIL
jgi:hypothetical protein